MCALLLSGLAAWVGASVVPEQIHIAVGAVGEMNVAWYTEDAANSTVAYGSTSDLGSLVAGSSAVYLKGHGYHHNALLTGLTPGQTYYYTVGDSVRSGQFSFKASDPKAEKVSINIFGDWGWLGSDERPMRLGIDGLKKNWTGVPTRATMELLKDNNDIDMVWHLGDIAYADDGFGHKDCLIGFCYEKVYNGFMNWIQNVSASLPYMVTPGNHESECHSPACVVDPWRLHALGNFSAYNTRWHMPSRQSGGAASMWYSFDHGPVHFIGINTETDFPGAGEEKRGDGDMTKCGSFGADGEYIRWLEEDLKQANASGKWIVAGGHRPWHTGGLEGAMGLLEKYGTAMYFAGHGHSYSRSRSENGTVVTIMVGGAGCDEMDNLLFEDMDETSQVEWAFQASQSAGYSTAVVSSGVLDANATHLSWRLIEGATQKIIDTIEVTR